MKTQTVESYMRNCLRGQDGFYRQQDMPIGKDFTTAAEISQMFGELLAVWFTYETQQDDLARVDDKAFIELGSGRGSMARDMQRVFRRYPQLHESLTYHAVDIRTDAVLPAGSKRHDDRASLPSSSAWLVVANEFFDCLPVRQFIYRNGAWHERLVGYRDGRYLFLLSPEATSLPSAVSGDGADEGFCVEYAPELEEWTCFLAKQLRRRRGRVLIIDYGSAKQGASKDMSLRAIYRGRFCCPLDHAGQADLSVAVDFGLLAITARNCGCFVFGLTTQRDFLLRLGIETRASQLIRSHPEQRFAIETALYRLLSYREMGGMFKVLCLSSSKKVPVGFEAL